MPLPFHRYAVRVLEPGGNVHEITVLAQNACGAESVALTTVATMERLNVGTLLVTYVCIERPS